jgi:hypothetical protein
MRRGLVGAILMRLEDLLHGRERRAVRHEALALYGDYGAEAVSLLRERIAAAQRYKDRRRLYQLHDEIARRLTGGGA